MSAAAATCHRCTASPQERPFFPGADNDAGHRQRAPSLLSRLAAALRARHRSRRTRAAFRDTYAALHRLDRLTLADIGIQPEQLTAVAMAKAAQLAGVRNA